MSSSSINLSSLLKVAGDDIIRAYRTKYFTTGIIEASGDFLSNKNAINWVNAENFQHFVVEWLQVPTPCTPQIIESSTSASALPLRQYKRQRGSSTSSEHPVVIANKRLRRVSRSPPPITWVTPNKSTGTPAKKHARYSKHQAMSDAGWIQITHQQWVKQLVELTEIPTTWPIPMEGESIGYILDLTNSAFKFIDSNGNPLSMAAIIKNKCVDGWGDGSGGTKDAGPVVFPLGKIKTQRAIHYEHYSDDFKTFEEIHNAQMANNAAEADSVIGVAAAVAFRTCKFNDGKCKGQPIIQTFERMTVFGKDQFIGCSARQLAEDKHAHIFFSIPLHVSQSTLNDIFTTQGSTSRDTEKYTGPCYYTVPPTVGLKQEKCPHVHFENGKLLNGLITRHQCPAQIIIYTPIDPSIRKAVVITTPGLPHNHPPYALQKLTFEATELYVEAIEAVGLLGSTVGQIDRAPTTKALLASQKATDSKATSSLTQHRVKQRILSGMKQKQYPEGKDIAGVKHMYENIELKRPVQERYIQSMHSELCNDSNDQIDVVVTMLPDLAELVHNVTSTQHDTTYKRVFGAFNEWEIVIWHPYLCRRVAIGRIYCNRETRQAYRLIWTEWFKAIERVTNKSIKFKALHKEGKHAIFMVDGSAPQMQGLGDFLLTQNDPLVSRIATKDPQIIVQYCSRICNIHCQRGVEPLKAVCSHEDYNRIVHFQYITTQEKMDEFTAWCLGHEQPKVRDWWRNKLAYPWYIPALCRHFSKVPSADWDLGPTNTNLNEQSHQATNRATGVHIPLAEAIDSAFEYDKQISRELQLASENCILTNHRNTLTHRFISNNHRTSLCIERVDTADRIRKEVTNIEIKLAAALEEKKIAIENVNQLRTEKKQVASGKKINLKTSGRGFPTPAVAISTEKENFPFPSLSLPSSSYHPTSAEPFYASLPPELEPPPSSYNVHLSYLQQSRLYTNSEPVFPSATCPPNLRSNQ
ncbi:hypothetical protein BU17DRAFT_94529 [Hysterangium stoloniferum]|nr:hypothetical protein BU17DRAFT_94529 [Hysterangium stoloniferum]